MTDTYVKTNIDFFITSHSLTSSWNEKCFRQSLQKISKQLVVYELTWKNNVEPDRPKIAVWSMHIACWIPKATNTQSKYVIFIAIPRQ